MSVVITGVTIVGSESLPGFTIQKWDDLFYLISNAWRSREGIVYYASSKDIAACCTTEESADAAKRLLSL